HVVFFRNVLIYFDRPTQKLVLERQSRLLVPGGYLFISHSENAAGLSLPLVAISSSVYQRPR
ncbi:MAG: chemotaxis protein CheR, partial [Myxococcales bacterium]|nr:chemotaxis protein CheR [Myxococcales bacterium]